MAGPVVLVADAYGRRLWSWGGVTFVRRVEDPPFASWFEQEIIRQVDPIVGSAQRYIDIGGATYAPLTLRAEFASADDLATILGRWGQTATLDNAGGKTATALLVKVAELIDPSAAALADLTFEYAP